MNIYISKSSQRKSKIEYYQNYFEKHKTNMKMLQTGIKSIVNLKAKQLSNISHLKSDGLRVTAKPPGSRGGGGGGGGWLEGLSQKLQNIYPKIAIFEKC